MGVEHSLYRTYLAYIYTWFFHFRSIFLQIHLNVVFGNCYFILSLFTFFHCEKFTFLIDLKNQNTSKRGFLSVYSFSTNTSKRGRKTI